MAGKAEIDITPLAPGEEAEATDTIVRSFLDDPLSSFVLRRRRREAMGLMFGALVNDAFRHGGGWAARSDGRLIGVSIWLPPGSSPVPFGRQLRQVPKWARLAAIDPSGLARAIRTGEALDELHPDEPHWFLSILAVDQDRRGRGVGRQLVEPGLKTADAAGVPVHLDTNRPENIPIYERLGFRVHDEIHPLPGSPPAWGMRTDSAR